MLKIHIPDGEFYNEETNEFIGIKGTTLTLEHSLLSISKWESKWHKPYLSKDEKTNEEIIDYFRCMTLTQNVNPEIYNFIPDSELIKIYEYIENPMTATTIARIDGKGGGAHKIITSEVLYYYMVANNIPFECEKWHLNRLLMLLSVCNEENKPKKKMSKRQVASKYSSLNAARRARLNTRG